MSIYSRKPLGILMAEASEEGSHTLKRSLGALNLTTLGIGAIIGAGIFVLTGQAAATYAGPGIVFSFIIAGLGCLFAGLCYAEFASMIPIAGSAYTYGYATLGEFWAWIIGWDLILEYLFAASTVSVGWSGYFVELMKEIGFDVPAQFASAPLKWVEASKSFEPTGTVLNLPAMALIAVISALLVVGIKESATFNNIAVFIKVGIVLAVIGFGFQYVNTANWHPFVPPQGPEGFGHFGWSGIVRGSAVVFFAYIGFDAVSTAAQEAKNPQRDLPVGILSSLAICTVLYILMALTMTGLVPYTQLNVPHPVFVAIDAAGPALKWLTYFINIGAIAGLSSVVLVMLLGQPRIFYAMSRDGLLPPVFGRVHERFRTPWLATIITGSVAMVFGGLFPIDVLGELVSIGTLLAFVIVCAGIWVLRARSPELPRPFKTLLVPLVPILGVAICLFMMAFLPLATWLRLGIWMAIGLVIYFFYGRHNSKLVNQTAAERQ